MEETRMEQNRLTVGRIGPLEARPTVDPPSSVINALKRLERAGSEHSKTTEKLVEAARIVAEQLVALLPDGVTLREFRGDYERTDDDRLLVQVELGSWARLTGVSTVTSYQRRAALKFAEDLAGGLLDQVASYLEKDAAVAIEATSKLRAAEVVRQETRS